MYKASIRITLRPSILDPQGKATGQALQSLGFQAIEQVRLGKYVELRIATADEAEARRIAEAACQKLLANPVMEDYAFTLEAQALEPA
jgi:phosphoribosylformylglycinamidine synthase